MLKIHIPDTNIVPPDATLIDGAELARRFSVSKKWVDKHYRHIVGSLKIGRRRLYCWEMIAARIARGQDILD